MIWRFWRSKFDTLLATNTTNTAVWRVKNTLGGRVFMHTRHEAQQVLPDGVFFTRRLAVFITNTEMIETQTNTRIKIEKINFIICTFDDGANL